MNSSIISLRIFLLLIVVVLCLNGCKTSPQAQYSQYKAVGVTDIPRELEQYKLYTGELPRLKTLDHAIKWYLNEKESNKYLEGQHFISVYRILDTIELPTSATVYAHILCEWIDLNGETVSGGAGLISINFNKNKDLAHYNSKRIIKYKY